MFSVETTVRGDEVLRNLSRTIKKKDEELSESFRMGAANLLIENIKGELDRPKPEPTRATDNLYESVKVLEVGKDFSKVTFGDENAPYATFVDLGVRPIMRRKVIGKKHLGWGVYVVPKENMVSPKKIEEWMIAKGISGNPFAIAASITYEGTKPQHISMKALDKTQKELDRVIKKGLEDVFGRAFA
jgi:hypothetical protein